MKIEANLNNVRISPRKVLVVAKMLSGLSVREASVQLERELRRAALPLNKLLASAVANAEHNFRAIPENLVVSQVSVGEGRKLKRWMPRAQGRATPIWKRMSRICLVLEEKDPELRAAKSKKKKSAKNKRSSIKHEKTSIHEKFSGILPGGAGKKASGAHSRSIFHRKSV